MTKSSQLYKNSHNSKYSIEKLHINTQTNQEKVFNTILVTWTQMPDVTILKWQLNCIVVINIEEDAIIIQLGCK